MSSGLLRCLGGDEGCPSADQCHVADPATQGRIAPPVAAYGVFILVTGLRGTCETCVRAPGASPPALRPAADDDNHGRVGHLASFGMPHLAVGVRAALLSDQPFCVPVIPRGCFFRPVARIASIVGPTVGRIMVSVRLIRAASRLICHLSAPATRMELDSCAGDGSPTIGQRTRSVGVGQLRSPRLGAALPTGAHEGLADMHRRPVLPDRPPVTCSML